MSFLLRLTFWLALVCIVLPNGSTTTNNEEQISGAQAVTLASAALSDARGFCDRQPDACLTGGKIAKALTLRLEAGARTIYEFVADGIKAKLNDSPASAGKSMEKAAANRDNGAPSPLRAGHGTLLPADTVLPWHAPVPYPSRRDAQAG